MTLTTFAYISLDKASHISKSEFNRMGLFNTPAGRGSRQTWTIVHPSSQGDKVRRVLLLKRVAFLCLEAERRNLWRQEEVLSERYMFLLLFLVRADFQLGNVRFWVWGLDMESIPAQAEDLAKVKNRLGRLLKSDSDQLVRVEVWNSVFLAGS